MQSTTVSPERQTTHRWRGNRWRYSLSRHRGGPENKPSTPASEGTVAQPDPARGRVQHRSQAQRHGMLMKYSRSRKKRTRGTKLASCRQTRKSTTLLPQVRQGNHRVHRCGDRSDARRSACPQLRQWCGDGSDSWRRCSLCNPWGTPSRCFWKKPWR